MIFNEILMKFTGQFSKRDYYYYLFLFTDIF